MERALGNHRPYFELGGYRVIVEEDAGDGEPVAEATVRLRVKGIEEHTAAAGNGPVHALDHALRKALEDFYPNLREMALLDYKVRILDESKATAARTRVLITSGDGNEHVGHRRRRRTTSSRRPGRRSSIRSSTSCGVTNDRVSGREGEGRGRRAARPCSIPHSPGTPPAAPAPPPPYRFGDLSDSRCGLSSSIIGAWFSDVLVNDRRFSSSGWR